jgi:SAM-dependent methyltransferase
MEGHTLRMWERITAVEASDLHGAVIGDFGCGPGRFVEVVRRKHGRVIALDLSDAVEVARANFRGDPDVLICQADVLEPPLKEESLDGAFSIGVLHHTPDPRRRFEKLVRCVKTGGWVAISVYGKGGYYDSPSVRLWRRIFRTLWPVFGHYPPLAYAYVTTFALRPLSRIPLIGLALRGLFPFVRLPDVRWSLLDTYDSVTPAYQSAHESDEVLEWFRGCGLADIAPSDWGVTAYHAVRK